MGMKSIRIGRIAGIPIGIQPLWLAIVVLIAWSLGASYYPDQVEGISAFAAYALGLLSALLLFASILLHELGHSLVARRNGVEIEEIDLWLLGGVARMAGQPATAGAELRFAIAGPLVTLAIAALFGVVASLLPDSSPAALRAVIEYQALVNTAILIFNLIPAFPLDGGRVTRALIWGRIGDISRATGIAASIGRGFGAAMIGLGVLGAIVGAVGGIWLALVGIFVIAAARAEQNGLRVRVAFSGREAGRLMSFPAITIPSAASVTEAIRDYFVAERHAAFPVTEGGRAVGLVNRGAIGRVPAGRRDTTSVGEIAIRDPSIVVDEHTDTAELLERPAFQEAGGAVVLTSGNRVGILSMTDVERVLRALELASGETQAAERQ